MREGGREGGKGRTVNLIQGKRKEEVYTISSSVPFNYDILEQHITTHPTSLFTTRKVFVSHR